MSVLYGISTRADGQMRIIDGTLTAAVKENRRRFFISQNLNPERVVSANLVHGNSVMEVKGKDAGVVIPNTDALITNTPGLPLTVTIADCLPLFFYDPIKKAAGIAHAGWRGVLAHIAPRTVKAMCETYGSNSKDIQITIGPHLRACHFEVKEDVAEQFADYQNSIFKRDHKIFIDLARCVTNQLLAVGCAEKNITTSQECTYESPTNYFSYRRDKPAIVEAMIAYITLN